jgi:hypothetical protein
LTNQDHYQASNLRRKVIRQPEINLIQLRFRLYGTVQALRFRLYGTVQALWYQALWQYAVT